MVTRDIIAAVLIELPFAALFFYSAYRIMRATAAATWHLRGRRDPLPPFWPLPTLTAQADAATTARMSSP